MSLQLQAKTLTATIDNIFHMDELETLANKNAICAIAYTQLITGINAALISPNPIFIRKNMMDAIKAGAEASVGEKTLGDPVAILEEKMEAVSAVFLRVSRNLDVYFTTSTVSLITSDLAKMLGIMVKGVTAP